MGHKKQPTVINALECKECNIPKGWGHEVIFENNELYCGKLLCFKAGARFSMHYHMIKDETWYVKEGDFIYKWIDTETADLHEVNLRVGDSVRQLPGQPHQLIALTDGVIFEVSTEHFDDDSYRVFKGDSNVKPLRGHVYYTLGDKKIDLRHFDYNKSQIEVESEYGWEACMYWSNIYHKELEEYFEIKPGDIFVDLGANIGMASTYAELKGAGKIYSIEADPKVFECLSKNKGNNWVLDNIAISDHIGKLNVNIWPGSEQILVDCTTFDELIKRHNITKIDYLKIDIEGAEVPVIKSISDDNWSIIDKIFLEYHENEHGVLTNEREEVVKLFLTKGFINYHIELCGPQTLMYFWR